MTRNISKAAAGSATAISSPMRRLAIWLAALCLSFLAYPAVAQHPYAQWADELGIDPDVSYDGTRLIEIQGHRIEAIERRAPGKMYTETNVDGMLSGIILREDLQASYILMPSMGFYQEKKLEDGMLQSSNGMKFTKIEKLGAENINGHPSTRFKTRFVDNDGKGVGMIWVTDTGVPIKTDMIYSNSNMKGKRVTMQFTELNLRAQDPAVFELPANLKPMGMGSMGNLETLLNMGGASQDAGSGSAPATGAGDSRSSRQQACLEAAVKKKQKKKDETGFGKLMSSLTATVNQFGSSEIAKMLSDADATADDIADKLGISEDDVERCRQLK